MLIVPLLISVVLIYQLYFKQVAPTASQPKRQGLNSQFKEQEAKKQQHSGISKVESELEAMQRQISELKNGANGATAKMAADMASLQE